MDTTTRPITRSNTPPSSPVTPQGDASPPPLPHLSPQVLTDNDRPKAPTAKGRVTNPDMVQREIYRLVGIDDKALMRKVAIARTAHTSWTAWHLDHLSDWCRTGKGNAPDKEMIARYRIMLTAVRERMDRVARTVEEVESFHGLASDVLLHAFEDMKSLQSDPRFKPLPEAPTPRLRAPAKKPIDHELKRLTPSKDPSVLAQKRKIARERATFLKWIDWHISATECWCVVREQALEYAKMLSAIRRCMDRSSTSIESVEIFRKMAERVLAHEFPDFPELASLSMFNVYATFDEKIRHARSVKRNRDQKAEDARRAITAAERQRKRDDALIVHARFAAG